MRLTTQWKEKAIMGVIFFGVLLWPGIPTDIRSIWVFSLFIVGGVCISIGENKDE